MLNIQQQLNSYTQSVLADIVDQSPDVTDHTKWQEIRRVRNNWLSQSDWTQFPDNNLTTAQRDAWQAYRVQLRDITEQATNPDNITWPEKPE